MLILVVCVFKNLIYANNYNISNILDLTIDQLNVDIEFMSKGKLIFVNRFVYIMNFNLKVE